MKSIGCFTIAMAVALLAFGCGDRRQPDTVDRGAVGSAATTTRPSARSASLPLALRRSHEVFVSPRGDDRRGDGGERRPYRTVSRAVESLPTVIDRRYSIVLRPGTYAGPIDLSAKFGSSGFSGYGTSAGHAPRSFVAIRPARPGTVEVAGRGRRPCVVARQINLLVMGLTCSEPAPVGIDVAQGAAMVDDVTVDRPSVAGIAVEHGQLFLGGDLRVTISGSDAIALSVRGGSAAREGTLQHPDMRMTADGGRIGVFVRDRSAFSIFGLRGGRLGLVVNGAYFGVNVQEGSSFFAGRNVKISVAGAHDAFIAQALSGIDADNVRIERSAVGAHATKRSVVVLDVVDERAVGDRVDSDKSSSVTVD